MSLGIVAFEILANDLQGKKKLSQNRTLAEQQNIIESLAKSSNSVEKKVAHYMQTNIDKV